MLKDKTRFFIFLWSILMMLLGLAFMLFPSLIVEYYRLAPTGDTGWSALSGNFAALITYLGVSSCIGAVKNQSIWLWQTLIAELLILIGRFVSVVSYGINASTATLIIGEIVIALVIVYQIKKLDSGATN